MEPSKFNFFFQDLKDFAITSELSSKDDFAGISEREIKKIETFLNKPLPVSIRAFLKLFGRKMKIKGISPLPFLYSFGSIKSAYVRAQSNYSPKIEEIKSAREKIKLIEPIDDFILLGFNHPSFVFDLVSSKFENPIVYYYYGGDELTTNNCKFTDVYRWVLTRKIISLLKSSIVDEKEDSLCDSLLEHKWVNYYYEKIKDGDVIYDKFVPCRRIFLELMYEEEPDRIYSINEWENLFIEFLD